ncbi:MAG: tyrosine-type recombinase/integrase [Ktedonobacterales bacterium]
MEEGSTPDGDDDRAPRELTVPVTASMRGELLLWDQPRLERNPAAVYIRRLGSVKSRRVMQDGLNTIATEALGVPPQLRVRPPADSADYPARKKRIAEENVTYLYCAWSALRYPHTSAVRDWLAAQTEQPSGSGTARYAPATVNRMLAALRGVLKEAWRLGEMSAEDYHRAADVQNISATTLPRGRSLTHGELASLLDDCLREPQYYQQFPNYLPRDARDAALIAMLYSIGLRRFEIVALDLEDYNHETGAVHIRHGKRRKARQSFLASGATAAMADWLAVRGTAPGPLFSSLRKGGVMTGRRLSDQAVYHILQVRQRQAHIAPFSPHDLRRTCVGDLLDAGVDITTAKQIVGHSSVDTTARYDRRGDRAKMAAADKLHVPYIGRKLAPGVDSLGTMHRSED